MLKEKKVKEFDDMFVPKIMSLGFLLPSVQRQNSDKCYTSVTNTLMKLDHHVR